jgi:NAD(P)H-hydrate epimerase
MRLISATEQRTVELAATKLGVEIKEMVGAAGKAAFEYIAREAKNKSVSGLAVVVLCGRGGNGADGFVIAERLTQAGAKAVIVLCCGSPAGEAPQAAYGQAVGAGVPALDINSEYEKAAALVSKASLIVDAVFGLGFKGELPGRISDIFGVVNKSEARVISIDMPSGVDADTGMTAYNTIEADATLYVIGKKPAHVFKSSRPFCGELIYLDIGIPQEAYASVLNVTRELTPDVVAAIYPSRDETGHKRAFGSVVCAVGSDRYRGAATLCARGALCGGAGLVCVASTSRVLDAVAAKCPEVILLDLKHDDAGVSAEFEKATAFVVGCGLAPEVADAVARQILAKAPCPVVIDAEGINALARDGGIIKERGQPIVLTPHIGEFAGLLGAEPGAVYQNRIRSARDYAVANKVTLVLKSENTIVAMPNSDVYINTIGNSGMAKAGSGDLLSGLIGSFCAMGLSAENAALLGVYLHSAAGDLAVRYKSRHSITPSVVAGYIPEAAFDIETANSGGE